MLHENDVFRGLGGEGWAAFTVEHLIPKHPRPELAGRYDNCALACRLCNTARQDRQDDRLLDPTQAAWADHFAAQDGRLVPRPDDDAAAITHEVYDLDDVRKVIRRRYREAFLTRRLEQLIEVGERLRRVETLVERLGARLPGQVAGLVETAANFRAERAELRTEIRGFAALPRDRPASCRCGRSSDLQPPRWLDAQLVDVDL